MIRRTLRQVALGSIRVVGATAERLSELSAAVLRQVGAPDRAEELRAGDPGATTPGPDERSADDPLSLLLGRIGEILDVPGGSGPEEDDDRSDEEELRRRFHELVERSRAAQPSEDIHPAFERIVDEISPDEARIIRFLDRDGPQPAIHVCSSPWVGGGGRTLLENVSLIGDRAGCHRPGRTPTYLDNLSRLGVIRIDGEEIVGHDDYELIDARPEVEDADVTARDELNQRAVHERLTVRLTALGERFCAVCVPRDGDAPPEG